MKVNFDLREKTNAKKILLHIQDVSQGKGDQKLVVPLILNRPEYIDLQFMPEGGDLIEGINAHIAFKAINEDGKSAEVSGKIYNSKEQEVATFKTTHKGIGCFNFVPEAGESYIAKMKLPDSSYKVYKLPPVKKSGIGISLVNPFGKDSIEVSLVATPDIATNGDGYFLMGQARGKICYGASFSFKNGDVKSFISKKIFPSGIVRFTLIGPGKNALKERILFIDHEDNLNIRITENKETYRQRDSATIQIKVTDKNGQPVQGSFSLAVTDNGQVISDSLAENSIITQMLLTSDLRGSIEDPGYYIHPGSNVKVWQDLDQLLLAQGWVGYDWSDVFRPAKDFSFPVEQEFLIRGRVINIFNKPVIHSEVTMISKKPVMVLDTLTNEQGAFTFKGIWPSDTAAFFIQSRNKKGESFNVRIEMEEFVAPVFKAVYEPIIPWYVNFDTARLSAANRQISLKKEDERVRDRTMLKVVVVTAKKAIRGSKNLNGPGKADIIIDQNELEKAGRKTLGDLLSERVPGFALTIDKSGYPYYTIYGTRVVHLIIDGINIESSYSGNMKLGDFFKQYLNYYDAIEIKGIEVMESARYLLSYTTEFLPPMSNPFYNVFIEITTYSGKGPYLMKTPGVYVYRPMAFPTPKKFYSPKYTSDTNVDMTDYTLNNILGTQYYYRQ